MGKTHFGIDENKDRHCDICGKFVDFSGHHNIEKNADCLILPFLNEKNDFRKDYINCLSKYLMSEESEEAIKNYCKNNIIDIASSPNIKGFLRKTFCYSDEEKNEITKNINAIDNSFMYTLTKKATFYRAITFDDYTEINRQLIDIEKNGLNNTNNKIVDKAFLSTTTSPVTAVDYLYAGIKFKSNGLIIKINANKEQKIVPILFFKDLVTFENDKEVLFPRDTIIKIKSCEIYKKGCKKIYYVEGEI